MNTQTTILSVLIVIVLGGVGYFVATDSRHMMATERDEAHTETVDHHDDENDHVASHEIYPGDVVEKMKNSEDIILLDVRTPEEYEDVHLTGATLLPVQELSQQSLNEIGLGEHAKDTEIILYCRSGARSKTAYDIMRSLGYTNIKSVAGGMIHWEEDGYPFTAAGTYEGETYVSTDTASPQDMSGPQITLDRTTHDFGVIPQYGGVVETDFTITNTGAETLEIGDLTTSCSCTSATVAEATVAPGKDTTVSVVFDPDFHEEPSGIFKRTVFIPTNDSENPEAEVSITVDIAEGE